MPLRRGFVALSDIDPEDIESVKRKSVPGEQRVYVPSAASIATEARELLDKWDLTAAWLRHTARILGNIIGAPEPRDAVQYFDVAAKAYFLEPIYEFLSKPSPLLAMMEKHG